MTEQPDAGVDVGRGERQSGAPTEEEVAQRWRLVLGADPDDGTLVPLSDEQRAMDAALAALYNDGLLPTESGERGAGLGASAPQVARWLGDIRSYFPGRVVQVMQGDAIDRFGLQQFLLEPEMLEAVQPDVHLVATLVTLSKMLPEQSERTAREVVAKVVAEVEKRLVTRMQAAVTGALNRARRTRRPRHSDIDWNRTIAANLKNYLPEYRTVVPERLVGHGRRQSSAERDIVVCVDQSGSMAGSVVYASILACVMASIRAVRTFFVAYDTSVVDLTDQLSDPVSVIFGTQLGGGTDTSPALDHCERLITRPRDTVLVLITDLYDSAPQEMVRRLVAMRERGVTVVVLLALDDGGAPAHNARLAGEIAALGIPAFACTPDEFPDLMAEAIRGGDLVSWVERTRAASAQE